MKYMKVISDLVRTKIRLMISVNSIINEALKELLTKTDELEKDN